MAKKGFDDMVQNSYVKICHYNDKECQNLQIYVPVAKTTMRHPFRRNSSFSNMEMFFKSLNEEDLDYRKHPVHFTVDESLHAFQV
jgi:hypothetical protein